MSSGKKISHFPKRSLYVLSLIFSNETKHQFESEILKMVDKFDTNIIIINGQRLLTSHSFTFKNSCISALTIPHSTLKKISTICKNLDDEYDITNIIYKFIKKMMQDKYPTEFETLKPLILNISYIYIQYKKYCDKYGEENFKGNCGYLIGPMVNDLYKSFNVKLSNIDIPEEDIIVRDRRLLY